MAQDSEKLLSILKLQPVVPVLIVDDAASAVPLARALVAGGLKAIEITMRTPAALDAIRAVAAEVEGANVGAGTILNAKDFEAAAEAGSTFIVSPGINKSVLEAARGSKVPLLPGAATASEVMALRDEGYKVLKFFPAEQAGGAPYLKALSSPLAGTMFCPTGSVSLKNANDYLSLPNVVCVGGSWVAPRELVATATGLVLPSLPPKPQPFAADLHVFKPVHEGVSGFDICIRATTSYLPCRFDPYRRF